jgi:hypothetical protein
MNAVERLVAAHPLLFRGVPPAVPSNLPDGWYGLVHKLCLDIEGSLGDDGCIVLRVEQFKERRGRLRFYYSIAGAQDRILDIHSREGDRTIVVEAEGPAALVAVRKLVELAVQASARTCQVCGAPGEQVVCSVWAATLCTEHAAALRPCDNEGDL